MTLQTWSKIIRERDKNTCLFCGSSNQIEAHHIKQRAFFPELITDIENGISLCHECHLRAHGGSYNKYASANRNKYTKDYCKPVQDFIENMRNSGLLAIEEIILHLEKGTKKKLKMLASYSGESTNEFIKRAIKETIERETK